MPPKPPTVAGAPVAEYDDDFEAEKTEEEEAEEEEAEEEEAEEEEAEEEEDEEADDDEADDDDEDIENPLALKVNKQGTSTWTVLKLHNEVKLRPFLQAVAAHAGYRDFGDVLVYYVPEGTQQRVPIASPKQLAAARNAYWSGTQNHLRIVVVDGSIDQDSIKHAMPSSPGDAHAATTATDPVPPPTPLNQTRATSLDGSVLSASLRQETEAIRRQIDEQGSAFRWTPMRSLGSGAYGQVFEALTDSGRLIAVKHLVFASDAPACLASTSQPAEELVSEIRLLKRLRHRHIVEYYGCQAHVQDNGSRVVDIFLEHCHGGSINALRHRFDKVGGGRLSAVLVRNYVRQVLRGLEYLHRKGVVHRDVKGDNVLIGGSGEAKLADFGCSKQISTSLAKTTDLGSGDLTGSASAATPIGMPCRTVVGTPLFMAPEVLKETTEGYTSSADVWSVGCLVIELFGHKPWKLSGGTLFSVMYAVATSNTPPTGMPDECDTMLRAFLMACFERDPSKRPTCSALLGFEWMICPDSELVEPVWRDDPSPARPASRSAV